MIPPKPPPKAPLVNGEKKIVLRSKCFGMEKVADGWKRKKQTCLGKEIKFVYD